MDHMSNRQHQPAPAFNPYVPRPLDSDTDRPVYNAPPPGSSALPYRLAADVPENSSYYHPPISSNAGVFYYPPSYTNPTQPLSNVSPKPITDPPPANTYPPPPNSAIAPTAAPPLGPVITTTHDDGNATLGEARARTHSALRELLATWRQHAMVNGITSTNTTPGKVNGYPGPQGEVEERVRRQTGLVLQGLRRLRARVGELGERAEGERWRRVVVGGVFASFIPLVKRLFRRPKDEADESTNRTEYAFKKSKSLVSRILASTHRPGLGTLAFFVFAVLYVFQNEVALRVARTVARRLKRLEARIEDGREELTEGDVKLLQGWRWRILVWSE
ncbi:hypothetical protein N657DRAFT_647840 [Parathielavia appendiculata]|uniref:Uncharacterized protein n=1 Tax=Parathielavia appendiculata TaxID=2587402 RepID=A0AAN6TWV1_9PEZI|nr:hypothetical protein N657DRAFT_647840 [Parathielavia appendiculata]